MAADQPDPPTAASTDVRTRQIAAVRDVMGWEADPDPAVERNLANLAAELVAAVTAVTSETGDENAELRRQLTAANAAWQAAAEDYNTAARERDQARARGWDDATAALRDDARVVRATGRWRAEAPAERADILPDIGDLLAWLMTQGDRAELNEHIKWQSYVTGWWAATKALRDGERYEHWWIYGNHTAERGDNIVRDCADYLDAIGPDGQTAAGGDRPTNRGMPGGHYTDEQWGVLKIVGGGCDITTLGQGATEDPETWARAYAAEHGGEVQRRTVTTTLGDWETVPAAPASVAHNAATDGGVGAGSGDGGSGGTGTQDGQGGPIGGGDHGQPGPDCLS